MWGIKKKKKNTNHKAWQEPEDRRGKRKGHMRAIWDRADGRNKEHNNYLFILCSFSQLSKDLLGVFPPVRDQQASMELFKHPVNYSETSAARRTISKKMSHLNFCVFVFVCCCVPLFSSRTTTPLWTDCRQRPTGPSEINAAWVGRSRTDERGP